jgi:hypothetical protein
MRLSWGSLVRDLVCPKNRRLVGLGRLALSLACFHAAVRLPSLDRPPNQGRASESRTSRPLQSTVTEQLFASFETNPLPRVSALFAVSSASGPKSGGFQVSTGFVHRLSQPLDAFPLTEFVGFLHPTTTFRVPILVRGFVPSDSRYLSHRKVLPPCC